MGSGEEGTLGWMSVDDDDDDDDVADAIQRMWMPGRRSLATLGHASHHDRAMEAVCRASITASV